MNNTRQLRDIGQSIWLDNITRELLDNVGLRRYIDQFSITGLTSNPTIFDEAIGHTVPQRLLWASTGTNRPEYSVIDHCTYAIVSDGDLMEGVASEAASLAGHLQLAGRLHIPAIPSQRCSHVGWFGSVRFDVTE